MFENKLKLNENKTDALLVSSSHPSKKLLPLSLSIGDEKIVPADFVQNLGMILDSHLTLELHVKKVWRSANYQLHRISRVRKCFDDAICAILVSSLVFPYLDYGNSLFYGLPEYLLDHLQRVQNSAVRLVVRTSRYVSATRHLKALHWLPVHYRIEFKIAALTYRCIYGLAPSYLAELVTPYVPSRELRSTDSCTLAFPKTKQDRYGRRSFSYAAPKVWNSFPLYLRTSPTFSKFCSDLKTLFSALHFLQTDSCLRCNPSAFDHVRGKSAI